MKLIRLINKAKKTNGRTIRCNETPADFAAANSYFSDNAPKDIIDESKTPIGKACGAAIKVEYHKNFKIMVILKPLPAKLSKANHNICITNTNNMIKNVAKKGTKKLFSMYLSKIFTDAKLVG